VSQPLPIRSSRRACVLAQASLRGSLASVLSWTVAFVLAGCGSGSSTDPVSPSNITRVSGVVAKGRVVDATVCAYRIVNGVVSESLGRCRQTDAAGGYQLEFDASFDSLIVEAKGGTYLDEASGNRIALGVLRAVPTTPASETAYGRLFIAHVTPITDLIVRRAQAAGSIDSVRIGAAANEVIQYFKIGASSTEPADLMTRGASSDLLSARYGMYLAGISALSTGSDLAATLDSISRDIGNRTMAYRNDAFIDGLTRFLNSPLNLSGLSASSINQYLGARPFADPN